MQGRESGSKPPPGPNPHVQAVLPSPVFPLEGGMTQSDPLEGLRPGGGTRACAMVQMGSREHLHVFLAGPAFWKPCGLKRHFEVTGFPGSLEAPTEGQAGGQVGSWKHLTPWLKHWTYI